jgi:hypothetical protein
VIASRVGDPALPWTQLRDVDVTARSHGWVARSLTERENAGGDAAFRVSGGHGPWWRPGERLNTDKGIPTRFDAYLHRKY